MARAEFLVFTMSYRLAASQADPSCINAILSARGALPAAPAMSVDNLEIELGFEAHFLDFVGDTMARANRTKVIY